jgi:hypothetical protein
LQNFVCHTPDDCGPKLLVICKNELMKKAHVGETYVGADGKEKVRTAPKKINQEMVASAMQAINVTPPDSWNWPDIGYAIKSGKFKSCFIIIFLTTESAVALLDSALLFMYFVITFNKFMDSFDFLLMHQLICIDVNVMGMFCW